MRERNRGLGKNRRGAAAPTIALSLLGLVAVGGIAFDYARLAAMDSELQNAADQAALAAAGQLDGQANACSRAASAAQALVANLTYLANDGSGMAVVIPLEASCDATGSVRFYQAYDPVTGAKGPAATSDTNANYVLVTVGSRTARYALTPIVAAFSGQSTASAFAGLESAYCNLPPFMLCKPTPNFNADSHIGAGMRLVVDGFQAPGNFGFLQTGYGPGADNLAKAIGWDGSAGGCIASSGGIETEPGTKQSVRSSFNTRFDMSESGQLCPAGGTCSASPNARKDLVHTNPNNCSTSGQNGWRETDDPYRGNPDGVTPLPADASADPDVMGHPRDLCHAASEAGTCTYDVDHIIGDGNWDRDAFFRVNYGWDNATWKTETGLTDDPLATNYATRWKVYLWEAANPLPTNAGGRGIGATQGPFPAGNGVGSTDSQPVCRPSGPAPGNFDTDRRVAAIAVVDCANLSGRKAPTPLQWIDVFLVEPVYKRDKGNTENPPRTGDGDIYVEIIRTRPLPGMNQSVGNVVRRDVPKLIE